MPVELSKTYNPKEHESSIYELWENSGAFKPTGEGEPFCIIMPPPNANGKLHWGHAIGYTTEDIVTRYMRMQGRKTLWLPGTDHAGIETQFVYERDVLAKEGKTRFDLGPKKFYQELMRYTKAAGNTMIDQFRAMGFSADWSKLKFTLDPDIIDTVYDTFIKLHTDGYIYRGNRLVNWCSRCQAAFADIELERREQTDTMYYLDYGLVQIATVRPETIFADVAVAVNPKDKKYKKLIGKEATIPLVDRPIPIITDVQVEPGSGTGALKVTPGHDQTDYEIGKRHNLPELSVIDPDGKLINVPDEYAGLTVNEARQKIAEKLSKAGKLLKTEEIVHTIAVHDRCGTIIEPLISEQWFLRVAKLNKRTIKAFETGEVKMHPARFTKVALDWLKQEHDWCISRQIWWGIRIPVYYKTTNDPSKKSYIVAKTEAEAIKYYGPGNYRAEVDTFDTWFSSGQWPFATLQSCGIFDEFYPTSLMGTAREILHKWITRMVMLGLYSTAQVPFKEVYLWGLVTDEKGQKMSKSKGNVVDPSNITSKYGTDALRLAGAISNTPGNDSPMSEKRVEAMRNFNNKLWNTARFVLAQPESHQDIMAKSDADNWFLMKVDAAIRTVNAKMSQFRINEAADCVYHLLWDDFADWYLEASKLAPNQPLLVHGLKTILQLAHPFVPFVSEAIWQQIPGKNDNLISSKWPKPLAYNKTQAKGFDNIQTIVKEIRKLTKEVGIKHPVLLVPDGGKQLPTTRDLLMRLSGVARIEPVKEGSGLPLSSLKGCFIRADQNLVSSYQQKQRIQQKAAESYIKNLELQLANKQFLKSAPPAVVKDAKQRLAEAKAKQA